MEEKRGQEERTEQRREVWEKYGEVKRLEWGEDLRGWARSEIGIMFPFFETFNSTFLINKKLKIDDDLSPVFVSNNNSVIPIGKLSHGELRLVHMLSVIADIYTGGGRWNTILIDEPEVGLHIDWQRELVSAIKSELIDPQEFLKPPVKIVIATHSPEIVASSPADAVPVTSLSEDLGVDL